MKMTSPSASRRPPRLGRRFLAIGFAVLLAVWGCKSRDKGHEHASDHPPGHDHHAEGHGHDEAVVRITLWSDRVEAFAEYAPAVARAQVSVLLHLTVLDGFRPLEGAQVRLELDGPAVLQAEAKQPIGRGAYQLSFVAPRPGKYRGRLVVSGNLADTLEGLTVEVFDTKETARASIKEHAEGRFIEFLKEQQWGIPFATAFVRKGTLISSIEVAGHVGTPPGGSSEVGAPVTGRLIAPARGLPRPGDAVRKGQVLSTLAPAPSSPEDAARARLTVSEAEARVAKASTAVERAERLIRDQAISQRELEDAQREVAVAEQALSAARSAQQLFAGAATGSGAGSFRLAAPIEGTLVEVLATPGATVAPGALLFRIVDTRELWIRARVPEQDAVRLRHDRDASFQISGLQGFLPIDVTGDDATASLVTIGRTVDAVSRTVDVIYSLRKPDPRLRVGGLVRVSVPAGEDFSGLMVPRTALVEEDGVEVAYIQVDGEHFDARPVRTGPRQGDLVGVLHGLTGDERLVVRGAHIVRLASRANSSEPHGHIH